MVFHILFRLLLFVATLLNPKSYFCLSFFLSFSLSFFLSLSLKFVFYFKFWSLQEFSCNGLPHSIRTILICCHTSKSEKLFLSVCLSFFLSLSLSLSLKFVFYFKFWSLQEFSCNVLPHSIRTILICCHTSKSEKLFLSVCLSFSLSFSLSLFKMSYYT